MISEIVSLRSFPWDDPWDHPWDASMDTSQQSAMRCKQKIQKWNVCILQQTLFHSFKLCNLWSYACFCWNLISVYHSACPMSIITNWEPRALPCTNHKIRCTRQTKRENTNHDNVLWFQKATNVTLIFFLIKVAIIFELHRCTQVLQKVGAKTQRWARLLFATTPKKAAKCFCNF